jgi:hypothetical protein
VGRAILKIEFLDITAVKVPGVLEKVFKILGLQVQHITATAETITDEQPL